jgi:serine/threonine protein kinase
VRCPHCGADNRDDARFCGACGRTVSATEPSRSGHAPPASASPDLTGREIAGRYRVLAKLGEGGMGAVYRGEQISLKRKVAIKLLRPELSRDAGLVRRFNAEAELAARISHPNTVNIHDFGQDVDGTLFIVMELVEGRSLRQVITSEGPLPPRRALAIAAQLAASLGDAHARGVVHRDLKPDNVMLTERGKDRDVVRVLDFGIAKLKEDGRTTANVMTQAGDIVGTPQYMAPEQIRGESVDGRTDVYALGAMMYEMLTGRLPFEGPSVMAILSKHLLETPEPPSRRRPDLGLPPGIDELVMGAMAKDIQQRIASMEQLAERIAALGLDGPPLATPPVSGAAWAPSYPPGPPPAAMYSPPPGPPPMSGAPLPGAFTPISAAPPVVQPFAVLPDGPVHIGEQPASRAPMWIGIGVVAVVGLGAGAWLLGRDSSEAGSGDGSGASAEAPDPRGGGTTPDPWASPTPAPTPDPAPEPPAPSPTGQVPGEIYRDSGSGWRVILPPGFSTAPQQEQGISLFAGVLDSGMAVIGVAGSSDMDDVDTDELRQGALELAQAMNGNLTSVDEPRIQGKKRFRAFIDVPPLRFEAVLLQQGSNGVIAMYGAEASSFAATEAARREFFERRLIAPGR